MGRIQEIEALHNNTQLSATRQELNAIVTDTFEDGWYIYQKEGMVHFDFLTGATAGLYYTTEGIEGLRPIPEKEGKDLEAFHTIDQNKLWADIEAIEQEGKKNKNIKVTHKNKAEVHNLSDASVLGGLKAGAQAVVVHEDEARLFGERLSIKNREDLAVLAKVQLSLAGLKAQAGFDASMGVTIKTKVVSFNAKLYAHADASAKIGWTGATATAKAEVGAEGMVALGAPSLFGQFRVRPHIKPKVYARAVAKAGISVGTEVSAGAGAFAGIGVDIAFGLDILRDTKGPDGKHFKLGTVSITGGSGYGFGVGVVFTPYTMTTKTENGKTYTHITFSTKVIVPVGAFGAVPINIIVTVLKSDDVEAVKEVAQLGEKAIKLMIQELLDTRVGPYIKGPIDTLEVNLDKANLKLLKGWNESSNKITKMGVGLKLKLGFSKQAFKDELSRHQKKNRRYLKDANKYISLLKEKEYTEEELDVFLENIDNKIIKKGLKKSKDKKASFYIQQLQKSAKAQEKRLRKQNIFLEENYEEATKNLDKQLHKLLESVHALSVKDLKEKTKNRAKLIDKLVAIEDMINLLDGFIAQKKALVVDAEDMVIAEAMEEQLSAFRQEFEGIYLILNHFIINTVLG